VQYSQELKLVLALFAALIVIQPITIFKSQLVFVDTRAIALLQAALFAIKQSAIILLAPFTTFLTYTVIFKTPTTTVLNTKNGPSQFK